MSANTQTPLSATTTTPMPKAMPTCLSNDTISILWELSRGNYVESWTIKDTDELKAAYDILGKIEKLDEASETTSKAINADQLAQRDLVREMVKLRRESCLDNILGEITAKELHQKVEALLLTKEIKSDESKKNLFGFMCSISGLNWGGPFDPEAIDERHIHQICVALTRIEELEKEIKDVREREAQEGAIKVTITGLSDGRTSIRHTSSADTFISQMARLKCDHLVDDILGGFKPSVLRQTLESFLANPNTDLKELHKRNKKIREENTRIQEEKRRI